MSTETEDGFAEWRGGLEARVSTLEATVKREAWARAKMDEDLSDLKIQFGKQDFMLKALSKTQSEHTATLREHGAMLREHGAMLREHGAMLREHGHMLRELRTGQDELRQDVTEIGVGIRTIIDLIDKRDVGEASRRDLPDGGQGRD